MQAMMFVGYVACLSTDVPLMASIRVKTAQSCGECAGMLSICSASPSGYQHRQSSDVHFAAEIGNSRLLHQLKEDRRPVSRQLKLFCHTVRA
jgi:hypothetical protein